ncbi:hypothetical protein [Pseudaestuariivita rosea]|uniref:hypothetical protein n=1 Tax=Pseudaestuariivita rosea TaxID=2763263 RepID=UPI001ABBA161|nr:hypothetical protein [Pseudaestuariivita rosea]
MYVKASLTVLALVIAAPAFANNNLARSVGVEPGVYTLNELAAIKAARESDDVIGFGNRVSEVVSTQSIGTSAGQAQLAASLGVDASDYTLGELAALKSAHETDGENFRVNVGPNEVISTQSGISAGHRQLAASLGLDANDYSLSELAAIKADREDDVAGRI